MQSKYLFKVLGLSAVSLALLSSSYHAKAETFLDRCFPNTTFLKTRIRCGMQSGNGMVVFELSQGKQIKIVGNKKLEGEIFAVKKIVHLPPRLSDTGAMDESVRFLAFNQSGQLQTTIAIPCGQTEFAAVGINRVRDGELPDEHSAGCSVD